MDGALRFSVLRIWQILDSILRFSRLNITVFGVGVLCGFSVFGFRFLSTMMAVFGFFYAMRFTVFRVLPRKLHPIVVLKL